VRRLLESVPVLEVRCLFPMQGRWGDWFVGGCWVLVGLCVFCSKRLAGVADNLLSWRLSWWLCSTPTNVVGHALWWSYSTIYIYIYIYIYINL